MPELFDRGHIYIAVPPLYKVKIGNQEFYFEKDAQLEELLVRERVGALEILPRSGEAVRMTESRWSKFVNALEKFEGWLQRLRADFGPAAADFMVTHRLVEADTPTLDALDQAVSAGPENGYTLSVAERRDGIVDVKVIENETSAMQIVTVSGELLASPVYDQLRSSYARLLDLVGPPPFTVGAGKKERKPETFGSLRADLLDAAKEGIQLSRFKGLGEMNHDQLWDTTMDPQRRLLIRVDVEDASAADRLFSTLMGDQVEPRREFIETNAKDVRFLDV
jgi:DNA gyrase subunit B